MKSNIDYARIENMRRRLNGILCEVEDMLDIVAEMKREIENNAD